KDLADIYNLTKEQLLALPLFKDKKADNLLAAIEKSKTQPLSRLLNALGIPHAGEKTARTLAERFSDMDSLLKAGREDFMAVPDVGPVLAQSLEDFLRSTSTSALMEKLRAAGLNLKEPENKKTGLTFQGMTVVFTGELKELTRKEAQLKVRGLGGKDSSSISPKTTLVVAGENAGSKLDTAQKLGIPIIDEAEFLRRCREH
ncbi:MAG TPA: helix-hairpin-helix domain-containing protein, partial [Elusimicrobiales bacterium]|nr:helix-hairpin-helix domain-containing protein [Elusimicrobiales bacterium]